MRYIFLILLFFVPLNVLAQQVTAGSQVSAQDSKGVKIREIDIQGFVLGDKKQFIKLFKPYRNKYLTTTDMDALLLQIQLIYEREGYQQLVTITYEVKKQRLVFNVAMTS